MSSPPDRALTAADLHIPEWFNAASYFVDRNVREGRGGKVAIECGATQVTYERVLQDVNRVGHALRSTLDVRMEERVLLLLLDTPEFASCFFGAMKIGAVPVPASTLLKPADYLFLLNDSRARVAMVSEALLPQLLAIPRDELPFLREIVVVGDMSESGSSGRAKDGSRLSDASVEAPAGTRSFAGLLRDQPSELEAAPTRRDDAAFWLYSSGSTGPPKGCVHLHHDMVLCAELYARGVLQITEADRCFSVAKLFFAYGLGNGLYFPFAVGATSILWPGPPSPRDVFGVIERHRPTLFFSVPTSYAMMLAHQREGGADFDLRSVRLAVSAGEALPAALYERFAERFSVSILDGIGSTEVLHIFISNRPGAVRPGSSGQIVAGYEALIVDAEGRPARTGDIGSLLVKGDSTCSGYWNQHEKTSETMAGPWIRTGDEYSQDEEGYYWHAGRSDDMLKVGGIPVSPVEIENTLLEHPAVREAGVVGCADDDELVKPLAYVALREGVMGTPELAAELQNFVRSRIAEYKRPRWVVFVEELPRTATGKTQRFKLRIIAASASDAR